MLAGKGDSRKRARKYFRAGDPRAWLRQRLLGRGHAGRQYLSPDHVARRDGLRLIRHHQHVSRNRQWQNHALACPIFLFLASFLLSSCGRLQPSPDREFAAVDRIFQSGHLAEAQIRAENARSRLSENHYWTARFLIEEAKIRLYQGQSFEAIQLLRDSWTQEANDHDLRIDRFLILALANLRIGNKSQAKEFLLEAEALCNQTPIDTQKKGYVWSTEGIFAYNENHLREALALFQQSLEASKVTGDRFLEAQSARRAR